MINFFKNRRPPRKEHQSFGFSRPLVLLHSDDWGRVGVRDREGFETLRSQGIRLGERPYDLYSLETAEDVSAVVRLLQRHHDASGRSPCLMMNTCAANLDFRKMREEGFRRVVLKPLVKGLPGAWSRPGLFDAYKAGIKAGVLQPALHGLTHFCEPAVMRAREHNPEHSDLLLKLWEAETPYIFWRMPWVGYEFWDPEATTEKFLTGRRQRELIIQGFQLLSLLFGTKPVSACAPGYRANPDTHRAWADVGIRVAVNGTGDGIRAPHMDPFGLLHVYRNVDLEPSQHDSEIEKYVELAGMCFARGLPLIISIHSINFHSTLKDFRSPSLAVLDQLLTALETKYTDLLYASDEDLYRMVTKGQLADGSEKVKVSITQQSWNSRPAQMGSAW